MLKLLFICVAFACVAPTAHTETSQKTSYFPLSTTHARPQPGLLVQQMTSRSKQQPQLHGYPSTSYRISASPIGPGLVGQGLASQSATGRSLPAAFPSPLPPRPDVKTMSPLLNVLAHGDPFQLDLMTLPRLSHPYEKSARLSGVDVWTGAKRGRCGRRFEQARLRGRGTPVSLHEPHDADPPRSDFRRPQRSVGPGQVHRVVDRRTGGKVASA